MSSSPSPNYDGIIRNQQGGLKVDTCKHPPDAVALNSGEYWEKTFEDQLKNCGLLADAGPLPRVERKTDEADPKAAKNGRFAYFSWVNNGKELASCSVPLGNSKSIPKEQIDALETGLKKLRDSTDSLDDEHVIRQIKAFRLPDPKHSPECYRISRGLFPWSPRHLIILWGIQPKNSGAATPPAEVPDSAALAWLNKQVAPNFAWLRKIWKGLMWLLILLLLALVAYVIKKRCFPTPPFLPTAKVVNVEGGSTKLEIILPPGHKDDEVYFNGKKIDGPPYMVDLPDGPPTNRLSLDTNDFLIPTIPQGITNSIPLKPTVPHFRPDTKPPGGGHKPRENHGNDDPEKGDAKVQRDPAELVMVKQSLNSNGTMKVTLEVVRRSSADGAIKFVNWEIDGKSLPETGSSIVRDLAKGPHPVSITITFDSPTQREFKLQKDVEVTVTQKQTGGAKIL